MFPVVAGIDGSTNSVAAVRWAFERCMLTGADLRIAHVQAPGAQRLPEPIATLIAGLLDEFRDAWIRSDTAVAAGIPGHELVELSTDATRLVIGMTGLGANPIAPGSTAHHVLSHAQCPVTVVNERAEWITYFTGLETPTCGTRTAVLPTLR